MSTPTLRTAARDANLLSLNRDTVVLYAGTPDERELDPAFEPIPLDIVPPDPKGWDSSLKCSDRHDTHLNGLRVAQGRENAFDANNGTSDCSFAGDWGVEGREGEQVFTLKGGTHHVYISGTVHSRGTRADLMIGAWSDQSTKPSHHLDFSGVRHVTGRPLTVILCRVNSPIRAAFGKPRDISLPPGAKVLLWSSLGAQALYWTKWLGVKLGIIKGHS